MRLEQPRISGPESSMSLRPQRVVWSPGSSGLDRIVIDETLDLFGVEPDRYTHENRVGFLVVDYDLALVGEIAVDIEPGGGAIEEEIDGGNAGVEACDAVPGVIESDHVVRRAAAIDNRTRLQEGGLDHGAAAEELGEEFVLG